MVDVEVTWYDDNPSKLEEDNQLLKVPPVSNPAPTPATTTAPAIAPRKPSLSLTFLPRIAQPPSLPTTTTLHIAPRNRSPSPCMNGSALSA